MKIAVFLGILFFCTLAVNGAPKAEPEADPVTDPESDPEADCK